MPALPSLLTAVLQTVLQTVRQPLLVLNADKKILFANRFFREAFPAFFAAPVPSESGDSAFFCGHRCPWDFPSLRALLENALANAATVEDLVVTLPFPTLGEQRVRLNASRLSGAAAPGDLILVSLEKVTEPSVALPFRPESETRDDALFEFSPLPSWVADCETFRILAVNQAAVDHYGYTRQEFLTLTMGDLRAGKEATPIAMRCGQAAPPSPPSPCVEIDQHRCKDGTVLDAEVRCRPLLYRGRQACLIVAADIFRDLPERRRRDAVLKKSVDMLQAITEGTTDAVFVKDREGRYLLINTAGARIMGAAAEDILGRDDSLFFDETMVRSIRIHDQRTMEADAANTYEEVGTSGGVTRTFLATKAPYRDSAGNVIGVIGISRDITELKQLQAQLAQSERMAAMGELVAGVAHELNNPLAAISGHAQLLHQHPDALVRADAETIQAMTDRAVRIVRSLVTFSRHVDNAERHPVSLHHLIDETLEMIRYKLRKSNVEVVRDLGDADRLPPVVAGRIEQVLLNLFNNAEYALRERAGDREIRVTLRGVHQSGGDWATIAVSDNGTGIPPEEQGRIFNPFFTTKPYGEGTGLGLSICHGILREHGGRLTVESDGRTGTTFTLWLPMVAALPSDT